MNEQELLSGCLHQNRSIQNALYSLYANNMMNVCVRYAKNDAEAKAIFIEGFTKVFNTIHDLVELNDKRTKDSPAFSLESWIKKQILSVAIDHLRGNKKEHLVSSTFAAHQENRMKDRITDEEIIQKADKAIIATALQQLSPSHRAIYNLHEIDGYSHVEISKWLDISEYGSKDSLTKAKFNIKKNVVRLLAK
jgi:RNA polymerase sigma factor (sigma-70 family)